MFSERLKNAWSSHNPKEVAALYLPDGVRDMLIVEEEKLQGHDAIAGFAAEVFDAFPDAVLEIRKQTGTGSTVTVEWTWRGRQTKDYKTVPGKGQSVVLHGIAVYELEGDLIREERIVWDNATLLAAAGLLG
jgi:steroid delta-isomerase-like uncharacterized protein